ncbi:MAG TPA: SAM-dependent methyltransferase [Verrucomicrobiae bacterium]|jgi:SAM-dependent MidA family methyltransferase|nr:SAM-dependent methyltransferase [Verrucomicrobiae bacterium]
MRKNLVEIIRDEIVVAAGGAMPFGRFMELALYCPNLGYYEAKRDTVGRRGDFYTSVSVGNLFGQMLAFQFAEWLEELRGQGGRLQIIEAGSHDGQLASDILTWLHSNRPALFEALEYSILEPSAHRREWQRDTLECFAGKIRWLPGFDASAPGVTGIIFSNELLDAFPVRRLGWDANKKKWFEWGVALDGEKLAWAKMILADEVPFSDIPRQLLDALPDNFTTEIGPAAAAWWRQAAGILNRGKLMAADYGLDAEDFFTPSRVNGTLRGFFRHQFADDLLANPGEQDLTAHVNFSEIQKAGEGAGLATEFYSTQGKFLTRILEKTLKDKNFGDWTSARGRQFQTLTHPEHLGRAFRVLVQRRE